MSLETRSVSQPIDQGMPPLAFSSNGHISTIEATLRRQELWATLTLPVPNVEVQKEHTPGVVVLVPIHTDARIGTMQHTLESLARQGHDQLRLVVADNGLSYQGRTDLAQRAQALGVSTSFADALPTHNSHRNPAHARTKGIELIRSLAEQHPEYRTNGIVFLDSDTAALPGAIRELEKTYRNHRRAVAVTSVSVSVPNLDSQTYATYMRQLDLASGQERLLPQLFGNGKVDVAAIAAFGSDIAIKTCGVYVDRKAIDRLESPFIRMPYGTGEDMILSTALGRLGDIYHNPKAQVLDQARESKEQVRTQRQNWGRDHAVLFADMAELGLTPPGIHILEPQNGHWVEWTMPHTASVKGLIINPEQLKQVSQDLKANMKAGVSYGPDTEEKLQTGIGFLEKLTEYIDAIRTAAAKTLRLDLPAPIPADPNKTRFSQESLTGLLSGNILGMHDVQHIDPATFPKTIFYGVRQAGRWQ